MAAPSVDAFHRSMVATTDDLFAGEKTSSSPTLNVPVSIRPATMRRWSKR
jgi:hypothetical protein